MATYLIEGNSTKTFKKVLRILKEDELFLERLLEQITTLSIDYLQKQVAHGVDITMIFDTWGSLLNENEYERFSLKYIRKIKEALILNDVPLIYYSRGLGDKLNYVENLNVDVLGIDSTANIKVVKEKLGKKFSIQGNLDVDVLKKDENIIFQEIEKILSGFGPGSGHIFNLGTGITPDIDPTKVKLLIDILRDISPKYHIE